jgi:hypothetical protein
MPLVRRVSDTVDLTAVLLRTCPTSPPHRTAPLPSATHFGVVEQPHAEGRHVYLFVRTDAAPGYATGSRPDSHGSSSSSLSLSTARNAPSASAAAVAEPIVVRSMLALSVIAGRHYDMKNLRPEMKTMMSDGEASVFSVVDGKTTVTEAKADATLDWTSTAIDTIMVMLMPHQTAACCACAHVSKFVLSNFDCMTHRTTTQEPAL